MIYVVTGFPRSGTSRTMAQLEAAGIPVYHEPLADEFNPTGYYESDALSGDLSVVPEGHAAKVQMNLTMSDPRSVECKMIFCRRDLETSLESLRKLTEGKGFDHSRNNYSLKWAQGWLDAARLWASHHPHIEVWFDDMTRNTPDEVARICNFLHIPDNRRAAMANVIIGKCYQGVPY